MIVEKQKARATLLGRRKRAIIIMALTFTVLLVGYLILNHFIRFVPFEDVDGTEYRIIRKAGQFGLYDSDGNKLEAEDEYSYFVTPAGTLVDVNPDTGATKIIAMVDTQYSEANDDRNNLLIFPKLSKSEISSLEVHNSYGDFTFLRYDLENDRPSNSGDFVIKDSPLVSYDPELFAELYVNAGYTISTRLEDPIKDANGEYSEYGLIPETRTDEEGKEYLYDPAYYVLTDMSGKKHKLIVGDKLVTGNGFYAQYVDVNGAAEVKRDVVYIIQSTVENSLFKPVEEFVKPQVVYQMSMSDYTDVEEFSLYRYDEDNTPEYVVGFTFIPLEERQGTIRANKPYEFEINSLKGYTPHADNISNTLYNFYYTDYVGVAKLAPSQEDFIKYGLGKMKTVTAADGSTVEEFDFDPKYTVSFYYDIVDNAGKKQSTIKQVIFVSEANEEGNYYAYTFVYEGHPESDNRDKDEKFLYAYDMISEVKGYCFDFLTWPQTKWINSNYVDNNIAFVKELSIKAGDYSAEFTLDNSKTPQTADKVSSSLITAHGKDSLGHDTETFSTLTVVDTNGFVWTITSTDISVINRYGEASTISTAYRAYNALGRQTLCVSGYIECADGRQVKVTPDTVVVTDKSGKETTYVRFATSLFRQFYQTLLVASVVDSYDLTPEEEKALVEDESKLILTMKITDTEGESKEYKFFKLTSRKAYITVNGTGGFYVMTDRVEKIVSDVQKFFNNQPIDYSAKN